MQFTVLHTEYTIIHTSQDTQIQLWKYWWKLKQLIGMKSFLGTRFTTKVYVLTQLLSRIKNTYAIT